MSFPLKHGLVLSTLLPLFIVVSFGRLAPAGEDSEPAKPDPYAVPEGTVEELATYLRGLMSKRPRDRETLEKTRNAALKAADKILAAKPDEPQAELAVRVKNIFVTDPKQIEALIEQLEKAKLPRLVRQVRAEVLRRKTRRALSASDEEKKKLFAEIEKFLGEGPIGRSEAGLAMAAGQVAERSDNIDLAVEVYTSLGKLLGTADDPHIAGYAKRFEGVVRRLTLIGNPIQVEGTVFGGDKLDWNAYKGKVVLLDFWATWCGPCVAEVPNMKRNYELYHDKGFEIVGIAVNDRAEAIENFIQQKEIPWTIVFSEDNTSPTPDYYGVMGIPTMILVGADGKVVSTRARGTELDKELEKLLGPVEEKDDTKQEESSKSQL